MPDNEPTIIVRAPSVWSVLNLILHTIEISFLIWLGVQTWLINKFMIVYAIGTARMERFAEFAGESRADEDLIKHLDPSLRPRRKK